MSSFAKMCSVKTPTIDLIIDLANTVYERDFRKEGRTTKSLGVSGLSSEEIVNLVNNGSIEKVKVHPAMNRRLIHNLKKMDNPFYNNYIKYQKEVE